MTVRSDKDMTVSGGVGKLTSDSETTETFKGESAATSRLHQEALWIDEKSGDSISNQHGPITLRDNTNCSNSAVLVPKHEKSLSLNICR